MRDKNAHLEKRLAGNGDGKTVYPKNSYSGLNSLRARLSMNGKSNQGAMGNGDGNMAGHADGYCSDSLSSSDHLKVSLGVPVYFFFSSIQINWLINLSL